MRHRIAVLTAVLMLTGIAGCGRDKGDEPSWQPGAAPAASAEPAGAQPGDGPDAAGTATARPVGKPPTEKDRMSAAGFGPYAVGAARTRLAKTGLIRKVSVDSNGCGHAAGLAEWGSPGLVFGRSQLAFVRVTNNRIKTVEGVTVGTPYRTVQARYPGGNELSDWVGAVAWYVVSGDFALLFRLKDGKVAIIEAGDAASLQFSFTDSEGC